jgi:hypothetical protein
VIGWQPPRCMHVHIILACPQRAACWRCSHSAKAVAARGGLEKRWGSGQGEAVSSIVEGGSRGYARLPRQVTRRLLNCQRRPIRELPHRVTSNARVRGPATTRTWVFKPLPQSTDIDCVSAETAPQAARPSNCAFLFAAQSAIGNPGVASQAEINRAASRITANP